MEKISYKTFVWPQNPHTYKEEYIRQPHFFTAVKEIYFDGMGGMQRGDWASCTAVSLLDRWWT